ncbi:MULTISPECIES: flagellar biosynthesis protein FlhB [Nitratireductor]|uniref:flagellar biosynthesis protein FlhB n=1 Tax=Nitratireductor TaxID=245876 RepID=UPI000D0E324F|nr:MULTISPECIES: flagellar biosynthesis protein FlhB [Nitratireductor]PSM18847.1 flagellar biosynthesis protein FlhB [Nitratireductor sp. StC3]
MSEDQDKDSKTEPATEKKIRDSIEKGNQPFSRETPILASFAAIAIFLLFFAYDTSIRLAGFLSTFLERPEEWRLETELDAISLYQTVFMEIGRAVMVVMFLLVAAGLAASVFQNMPRFVGKRVMPKFSRISLIGGWKRVFGVKGFVEFLKSLGKVLFAMVFLYFVMHDVDVRLLQGMVTHPLGFGLVIRDLAVELVVTITIVMVLIAAADLLWSRYHWLEELRMTKQEVKDEVKQAEGDPILKSRMRSLARDRARQRMMAAVPRATLVVANPTHYAVALRYVREESAAPVVVAKGQDLIALKIREIAEEHNVPVFEDVALARSIFKQVSVDSMIPPHFYEAVAELVRIIHSSRNGAKTGKSHS